MLRIEMKFRHFQIFYYKFHDLILMIENYLFINYTHSIYKKEKYFQASVNSNYIIRTNM